MKLKGIKFDTIPEMNYHPLCELFPEMDDDTYEDLVISMQKDGFFSTDPIVIIDMGNDEDYDYQILDGRNRHLAANDARVDPCFVIFEDGDPLQFVLSKNMARRHLTSGQKAAIASKLANMKMGDNQFKEGAVSQEDAAKAMDTSDRSIRRYNEIKDKNPELAEKVESGEITLNAAHKEVNNKEVESAEDAVATASDGEKICPHCGQPM